jgi:fructokinase
MRKFTIVGLGEVLWDVFPEHKQLGGAPTNFAYISCLLGDDAVVASRAGTDALGEELAARLQSLGLGTSHLQRDPSHPTGTVQVEVSAEGQPNFEIVENVAWDFVEWTPELQQLASNADAVCIGTLAQRSSQSRDTIRRFLAATGKECVRVFDVNLRQAFYSPEVIHASAKKATIIKMNHEEVPAVMQALGAPTGRDLQSAQWLNRTFGTALVCVTRGSSGSLLVAEAGHHEHPGYRVRTVDTVGAGDAFTATMVHHFLRGSDLATMNDAANRIGAWVASKPGATPARDDVILASVRANPD